MAGELPAAGGAGGASPGGAAVGQIASAVPLPNDGTFTKLGANAGPKGAAVGLVADTATAAGKAVIGAPEKALNAVADSHKAGLQAGHQQLEQGLKVANNKAAHVEAAPPVQRPDHPAPRMPEDGGSLAGSKHAHGKPRIGEIASGVSKAAGAGQGVDSNIQRI